MSRVLVVGLGFLGRRVAGALSSTGHAVRVLTPHEATEPLNFPVVLGDADDRDVAAAAVEGCDAVVWCAGRLLPTSGPAELGWSDDVTPLHTVLTELSSQGGHRFVYLSSGGTVYGNPERLPVRETDPLRPISIYGATKVRGERYVQEFGERADLHTAILRCGNVYGPGQRAGRSQGVVANALACQREQRPFPLRADLSSVRDYVFVDDVVEVVEACLMGHPPAVMNVGTGIGTRLSELLDLIRQLTGALEVVRTPEQAGDVGRIVLDISRLRAFAPNFTPVALECGLERTCRGLEPLFLG